MVFGFWGFRGFEGLGFRVQVLGFGVLVSAIFEERDGEGAKKKSHWVKPHLFKGRAPKNQNVIRGTIWAGSRPQRC